MALDLTDIYANANDIKRNLKYEEDVVCRFYNLHIVILELREHWHFRHFNSVSQAMAGAVEFVYELSIADVEDELDLSQIIPITTDVAIDGMKYKIVQYDKSEGVTRKWRLSLNPTGETE